MRAKGYTLLYIGGVMAVCAALSACGGRRVYDRYAHTDESGWERNDTLTFTIPRQEAGTYRLRLNLRATLNYPYQELYIRAAQVVSTTEKNTKQAPMRQHTDLVGCRIVDNKGMLMGKRGISGNELSQDMGQITLRQGDSLTITLHHCMNREILPGITDVGITMERQ